MWLCKFGGWSCLGSVCIVEISCILLCISWWPSSLVPRMGLAAAPPSPPGRALRVRAQPTVPTAGPTRALAIAPLRAAPAGGGEVAGGGAREAGEGGARFPEQPAQKEERKKINPWLKLELLPPLPLRGRVELPRADDARGARAGLGALRPETRGSYGYGKRRQRRRLTGVGPGGGGLEQHVRQRGQGLGRALRQPGPREVSRGARGGTPRPLGFRGPKAGGHRAGTWALVAQRADSKRARGATRFAGPCETRVPRRVGRSVGAH